MPPTEFDVMIASWMKYLEPLVFSAHTLQQEGIFKRGGGYDALTLWDLAQRIETDRLTHGYTDRDILESASYTGLLEMGRTICRLYEADLIDFIEQHGLYTEDERPLGTHIGWGHYADNFAYRLGPIIGVTNAIELPGYDLTKYALVVVEKALALIEDAVSEGKKLYRPKDRHVGSLHPTREPAVDKVLKDLIIIAGICGYSREERRDLVRPVYDGLQQLL